MGRSTAWRRCGPRVVRLQARLQLDVGPRCREEPGVLGDNCAQLVGPHQTCDEVELHLEPRHVLVVPPAQEGQDARELQPVD